MADEDVSVVDALAGAGDLPQITFQSGLSEPGAGVDLSSLTGGGVSSSFLSNIPTYAIVGIVAIVLIMVLKRR